MTTYWHMQMHPDDKSFADEHIYDILENRKIIGLGQWEEGKSAISTFKHEMDVNDIVAIKTGSRLIALVQVIGGAYEVQNINGADEVNNDSNKMMGWIVHRRPIRVLDWDLWGKTIPQPRGTIERCVNEVDTTKIIRDWHERVVYLLKKRGVPILV